MQVWTTDLSFFFSLGLLDLRWSGSVNWFIVNKSSPAFVPSEAHKWKIAFVAKRNGSAAAGLVFATRTPHSFVPRVQACRKNTRVLFGGRGGSTENRCSCSSSIPLLDNVLQLLQFTFAAGFPALTLECDAILVDYMVPCSARPCIVRTWVQRFGNLLLSV